MHTLGTWKISGEFNISGKTVDYMGVEITSRPDDSRLPDICVATVATSGRPGATIDNARLIAAAPELLASLEEMVNKFGYARPEGIPSEVIAAHAAIAKTKG